MSSRAVTSIDGWDLKALFLHLLHGASAMNRFLLPTVVFCALLGIGLAGLVMANGAIDGDEPAMMVSPSVIVLAKVSDITVHTNIVAAAVVPGSVTLDGVSPIFTKSDNRGHLVARFLLDDLSLEPGEPTLTLTGEFLEGEEGFIATDVVRVK
jgi:hypothetical protein